MTEQVIEAEQPAAIKIAMMRIPVTINSTGRPAVIELPQDVTDAELLEVIGWLGGIVAPKIRAGLTQPRSPIEIARGLPS